MWVQFEFERYFWIIAYIYKSHRLHLNSRSERIIIKKYVQNLPTNRIYKKHLHTLNKEYLIWAWWSAKHARSLVAFIPTVPCLTWSLLLHPLAMTNLKTHRPHPTRSYNNTWVWLREGCKMPRSHPFYMWDVSSRLWWSLPRTLSLWPFRWIATRTSSPSSMFLGFNPRDWSYVVIAQACWSHLLTWTLI